MKKLKQWWKKRRVKWAKSVLMHLSPQTLIQQLSISQYEVKELRNEYRLPRRPSYFDQLSKAEQDRWMADMIKQCAHTFVDGMLENELISIYISARDGNPEDLVMSSALKLVKLRYDEDPYYRATTGTLSMDGHPYRVFPRQ